MHNNDNNYKKSNQFLDEIISPMFGHDYQNRVVPAKIKKNDDFQKGEETNYLEKQIAESLEAQSKIEKTKEYQESLKADSDVLKQYHKQKENEEIKASLPSNYLNFRDNLEKTDSSIISDFSTIVSVSDTTENSLIESTVSHTISEIVDEIFDKVEN